MKRGPVCGYSLDGVTCGKRGAHFCKPRADHAQKFCEEVCVHTKDRWARHPFKLSKWQRDQIVRPLFGQVVHSGEWDSYVRQYRLAWIELARKNGKSELLAFIALYLLVGDGVYGSEVYGCARDRDQARKVWDVADRMTQLSPALARRLQTFKQQKRIVDDKTGSYYEVVSADAAGNLGHNPHGVIFDEVLTQRDSRLWDAMRTGMGARAEPLLVAATTAGSDMASFAKAEHDECLRVQEDPERAPHRFVFMRNAPMDADPWDEANWRWPNPALGEFLSLQSLRDEATEAQNDPSKENIWRQFRLNQWVQQATRWMPLHLYDDCTGEVAADAEWMRPKLQGRQCFASLDLAAKYDLTSWALFFPGRSEDEPGSMLWRYWLPETVAEELDKHLSGQLGVWARDGWITLTEGDVVDYDQIYADIQRDHEDFKIHDVSDDPWSMEPVRQEIRRRTGLRVVEVPQTYVGLSPGMTELMRLTRSQAWWHHGNPVSRWCFDNVEVRSANDNPDLIRPVKPAREASSRRIDGVVTAAMAVGGWAARGKQRQPNRRMVVMR